MSVEVLTQGGGATLQTKTVTPTNSTTEYNPSSRYDGFSRFIVNGDSNLISSNIKNGTTIFNVTGNYITPSTLIVPTKYSPSSSSLSYEIKRGYVVDGNSLYWEQQWNPDYFDFSELKKATACNYSDIGATYPKTFYMGLYHTYKTGLGFMKPDYWNGNSYFSSVQGYIVFCYSASKGSSSTSMEGGYTSNYGSLKIDLDACTLKLKICSTSDYLYTCLNNAGSINGMATYYNATNFDNISFYY